MILDFSSLGQLDLNKLTNNTHKDLPDDLKSIIERLNKSNDFSQEELDNMPEEYLDVLEVIYIHYLNVFSTSANSNDYISTIPDNACIESMGNLKERDLMQFALSNRSHLSIQHDLDTFKKSANNINHGTDFLTASF